MMACNESRDNLKLGGTADLIRPKHDRNIMLGIFYLEERKDKDET